MSSSSTGLFTPAQQAGRLAKHRKRKLVNVFALLLSFAAMAFGVFWLVWILFETFRLGVGGLALSVFTEMTPPPMADVGGLANAIFGSIVMAGLATLLGTPIGVMAGIYLAEYGQKTPNAMAASASVSAMALTSLRRRCMAMRPGSIEATMLMTGSPRRASSVPAAAARRSAPRR